MAVPRAFIPTSQVHTALDFLKILPAMPANAPSLPTHEQHAAPIPDSSDSLQAVCAQLHARLQAFLQEDVPTERLRSVQAQTRISLDVIKEALTRYSLPEISLSYNGGKDCLVLLILLLAALGTHPAPLPALVPSVYIVSRHPFPEVDAFVTASSRQYHLAVSRHTNPSMKVAFADYLAEREAVKCIFVGTRRTDPHGGDLTFFDRTDRGWPAFMRCHPVIDWHYAEIWTFIRHLGIPYCELYDQGYTSLGGTTDTHPNPALKAEGQEARFRPAYELEMDEKERLGRDR